VRDGHSRLDHQGGEASPVQQDDVLRNVGTVLAGFLGKGGGGDEDSLLGFLPRQGAEEGLDLWPSDRACQRFACT